MTEQVHQYTEQTAFDLSAIYESSRFCDCVVVVENQEFKAHRVILAASSKYFNKVFEDETVTRVELKDISKDSFSQFLLFTYTNKINVSAETAQGLLRIAYNLEAPTLLDVLAKFLDEVTKPAIVLTLLKEVHFALSKLPRFLKMAATSIEDIHPKTDFSFMDKEDFRILIKKSRFPNQYIRDDIIERYCKATGIDIEEFAEFKAFDPSLPDESVGKMTFSAVCLTSPPDSGLFARLGPDQVEVFGSGALNGRDPSTLIEEDPIRHWFTESDGNAWVLFEFKELYIQPTHYGIWSHGGSSTLRNWSFQASNDRSNWIVLSTHNNDESIKEPFSEHIWPIDTNGFWRYFRIIQTGNNWSGNRWLYMQRVEIWGVACSKDKF